MSKDKSQPPVRGPKDAERRTSFRDPLHLSATFSREKKAHHPCIIKDYCDGGMLLQLEKSKAAVPAHGDDIDISVFLSTAGHQKTYLLSARVVRVDVGSMGVSFNDPAPSTLSALREYARHIHAKNREASSPVHDSQADSDKVIDSSTAQDLLLTSRHMIDEAIDPLLKNYLEKLVDTIFESTKDLRNVTDQNAYYDALRILDKTKDTFTKVFRSAIKFRLDSYSAIADVNNDDGSGDNQTLSLVEDEDLEEWLSITDLVAKSEEEYDDPLFELENRIACIFNAPINRDNNPYGPALFAHSFQDAINSLELEHQVIQVAYTVFKTIYIPWLGELYQRMNQYFIENNILPVLRREYGAPVVMASAGSSSDEKKDEKSLSDQVSGQNGGNLPGYQQASNSELIPSGQDFYSLMQEIRSLKQRLANDTASGGSSHGLALAEGDTAFAGNDAHQMPSMAEQETPVFYSTDEVSQALSNFEMDDVHNELLDHHGEGLKSQISSFLSTHTDDGLSKSIAEQNIRVIEVASDLFNSMFNDLLLTSSVKQWMKKLEAPLLKLALSDESVFFDKKHVARQVLNKLAQLELYEKGEKWQYESLRNTVERIIETIRTDFDGNKDVFENAAKELGLIVELQEKAYAENIRDVINDCKKEQKKLDKKPKQEPDIPDDIDEKWDGWLKRVRRIKLGSWIYLTDEEQRLRLAWVSKNKYRYVLVNMIGLREAEFSREKLAYNLYKSKISVLDNAGDPALDRAQYSSLQELHHQLVHESTHDPLTGLINRRDFENGLKKALASAKEHSKEHTLCYIDLDQLTVINNTCGYDAGDKLLVEVSKLLQEGVSDNSILARIGSDEFGLLLKDCPIDEAIKIAERLLAVINDYRLEWEDKRLSTSFSMGIVPVNEQSNSATNLLQAAESSCSIAKDMGSSRIQEFRFGDSKVTHRQQVMEWVARIDKALDEKTLELRCQSIKPIHAGNGDLQHYEILLKITDEFGNAISPEDFIRAAEVYNRISAVDRWVISEVFHWMADHSDKIKDLGYFAINISGKSLNDDTLIDYVKELKEKTNAPMDRICFEITETAGISNLSDATEFIEEIKKIGCKFSLDDFGSGMSSYAYLKNLPVDYLKIDGAFITDLKRNPSDYAVVKSVCEIGHFLGKKIIAEFVEDDETLDILRDIDVDYVQGYGIERPRPLDELLATTG